MLSGPELKRMAISFSFGQLARVSDQCDLMSICQKFCGDISTLTAWT